MSLLSFRAADANDLPTIIALAQQIWQDWYPAVIGQAQVDFMLNRMYSAAALQAQMEDEGQQFHLLFVDNQAIGYAAVSAKNSKDFFIHKFYIDTKQHRRGLGGQFLQYIIDTYQPQTLRLTVNRQNYIPINFYFRQGFTIEQVADFDIGGGYFMNDFVMLKTLN
jgi:GNAT superfamily N-acetyltransferase